MKRILTLAVLCLMFTACNRLGTQEVHVFSWRGYIPEKELRQFEKDTGIKVVFSAYDSNEAMYAKLKRTDSDGYDVVVPSTYYIGQLVDEKLIQPLDHNKIKNFEHLDPRVTNQKFDPGNRYSVPFLWGTTAIGIKKECNIPIKIRGWKDLWRPELKGKVMLQDDFREVFHIALKKLGYSGNSTDEKELAEAYAELEKLMPSVRLFNPTSPKVPIYNDDVCVANMWSGEAYNAANNIEIEYVYPEEGALIWGDGFAIPTKAKNIDNAYKFIDFFLRADVSARISNKSGYTSPVIGVQKYLNDSLKTSNIVYPSNEDTKNAEFQLDIGDAVSIYEKYWEKLTAKK